jgi:hypothetical protein
MFQPSLRSRPEPVNRHERYFAGGTGLLEVSSAEHRMSSSAYSARGEASLCLALGVPPEWADEAQVRRQ